MFEGRSADTKRALIRRLIGNVTALGIGRNDLEISFTETPMANWGIRGVPADALNLDYPVDASTVG